MTIPLIGLVFSAAAALATAVFVDLGGARAGLLPPAFAVSIGRRAMGTLLLSFLFAAMFFSIFHAVYEIEVNGTPQDVELHLGQLVFGQAFLLILLGGWYVLGYAGVRAPVPPETLREFDVLDPPDAGLEPLPDAAELEGPPEIAASLEDREALDRAPAVPPPIPIRTQILRRLGLECEDVWGEIRFGVMAGFGAWLFVLLATAALAAIFYSLGLGDVFQLEQPPAGQILWMASQPVAARLLISLMAGVSEELFFRGFLQPRIGMVFSTFLFAISHASYGQPMLLVSVTILSLIYAELYRRRGNVWAAMTAHTLFDAIQLLLVIPAVLKAQETVLGGLGGIL